VNCSCMQIWEMTIDRQRIYNSFDVYMLWHDMGEDYWSIYIFLHVSIFLLTCQGLEGMPVVCEVLLVWLLVFLASMLTVQSDGTLSIAARLRPVVTLVVCTLRRHS
jgi:hypothetical protein